MKHVRQSNATNAAVARRRYLRKREQVLVGYGGVCVCCGEAEPVFLALDHVKNDGAARRRAGDKSNEGMYNRLIREDFPADYQLLCHNCNYAKHALGVCPHRAWDGDLPSE